MTFDELDPGIREVVRWLRASGFETTDSGDGVSKPADERAFDEPHVIMTVAGSSLVAEADRLADCLRALGLEVDQNGCGLVTIEASYDPVTRVGIIALLGLGDAQLGAAPQRSLRLVQPAPDVPVIGGAELAAWLQAKAECAARGEVRAAAVVLIERDAESVRTSWHNDTGVGLQLLAGAELLRHRMAAGLTGD